jgi:hypothetical protein
MIAGGMIAPSWAIPQPQVGTGSSISQAPAATAPSASAPSSGNQALSVTVQGEVRGEVALERIHPPLDGPLQDFVELSLHGETKRMLKENVGYLGLPEQMKLITLQSPLAKRGILGEIPTYPFFVAKNPVNGFPGISKIVFQVLDETNQVLKETEIPVTQSIVTWDGYGPTGQFSLRARDIYLPIFQVTHTNGQVSTLAGDGVKFDAMRYKSGADTIIEIYNGALYPEDTASFLDTAAVSLNEILNELKLHYSAPFEVVIYDQPRYQGLAQERANLWRQRLSKELLRGPDLFNVRAENAGDRGVVTSIRIPPEGVHP